ncbi:MAG TPA: STAS/SEC14 domain-containing protein [Verrucomicrobiae bacterium]|jgi:hypothetical protein
MAIQFSESIGGKTVVVRVSGKLSHEDFLQFVPEFEEAARRIGKFRVLFVMDDFHGWETDAVWDEIKFDLKHVTDIERMAMVGDKKWEKNLTAFCKPFSTAKIRYFDQTAAVEAQAWLEQP